MENTKDMFLDTAHSPELHKWQLLTNFQRQSEEDKRRATNRKRPACRFVRASSRRVTLLCRLAIFDASTMFYWQHLFYSTE